MKKKRFARYFSITFALLLSILSMSVQVQAATTSQTAAKKVVQTYFNAEKKNSTSGMNKCLTSAKLSPYDTKYFIERYNMQLNKQLSYAIQSVKVSGSKATVKAKVSYMSAHQANYSSYWSLLNRTMMTGWAPSNALELITYHSKAMETYTKSYPAKRTTQNVTITLKKKNGSWKIVYNNTLENIATCGYVSGVKAASEEFNRLYVK